MEIFQVLVDFMRESLAYCYQLTQMAGFPSYGVAIIVLTILIKAILAPLTVKQIKSMKGMQELQPRMKAIQDKYKWLRFIKKWVLIHYLGVYHYWYKCHS